MSDETFSLPRFQEIMRNMPPRDLPTDTRRRYSAGKLPKTFINLLIVRPDLAKALINDLLEQHLETCNAE